jgi:hypothetical protein
MKLKDLTNGEYWKKSPLAVAIAKALHQHNKNVDIQLALDAISELDHWLQTESGKVFEGIRWIFKTFKDWWHDWLPTATEYKVRQTLEVLRELGIFRFEQHQLHQKRFDRCSWWSIDYEKLKSFASLDHLDEIAYSHLDAIANHTHTDTTVQIPLSTLSNEEQREVVNKNEDKLHPEPEPDLSAKPQKTEDLSPKPKTQTGVNIPPPTKQNLKEREKFDWEIEPGKLYPDFIRWRANTWYKPQGGRWEDAAQSCATSEILRKGEGAAKLWEEFLVYADRSASNAIAISKSGGILSLPSAFSDKPALTSEEVGGKLAVAKAMSQAEPEAEMSRDDWIEKLKKTWKFPMMRSWVLQQCQDQGIDQSELED